MYQGMHYDGTNMSNITPYYFTKSVRSMQLRRLCVLTPIIGDVFSRGHPNFSREQQGDKKPLDSTCFP